MSKFLNHLKASEMAIITTFNNDQDQQPTACFPKHKINLFYIEIDQSTKYSKNETFFDIILRNF